MSRAAAAAAAAALASASDVDALLTGGVDAERHDRRSSVPPLTIGSTTALAAGAFASEQRSVAPLSSAVDADARDVDDADGGGVSEVSGRRDEPPRNVRNVLMRDVMVDVTSALDSELLALAMMCCGRDTSVARLRGDENGRGPGNHVAALSSSDPRDASSPAAA